MKNLILLYREYIKFLEDNIDSNAVFLNIHHIPPDKKYIEEKKELRKKIEEAEEKLL